MNVRIFWVRAMNCMCAQTRPRFILSSERVLGGMEFEPMLTPREKNPLHRKISPAEDRTLDAVDSEPKHYQRAIPAPPSCAELLDLPTKSWLTNGENKKSELSELAGRGHSGLCTLDRRHWTYAPARGVFWLANIFGSFCENAKRVWSKRKCDKI